MRAPTVCIMRGAMLGAANVDKGIDGNGLAQKKMKLAPYLTVGMVV